MEKGGAIFPIIFNDCGGIFPRRNFSGQKFSRTKFFPRLYCEARPSAVRGTVNGQQVPECVPANLRSRSTRHGAHNDKCSRGEAKKPVGVDACEGAISCPQTVWREAGGRQAADRKEETHAQNSCAMVGKLF